MKIQLGLFALVLGLSPFVQAKPSNKELRVGISQEFETLHPLTWMNDVTFYVMNTVNRGMVYLSPQGEWKPDIAKTIPTVENGLLKINEKNGRKTMMATWEIRENAKWGDGTPITCADLKLAWEIGLAPTVTVGTREDFDEISAITWNEKKPKVCTYSYNRARWNFYKNIPAPVANHIERAIFEKHKGKADAYLQSSSFSKDSANPGIYNGPYVVTELKLGSHILLKPNPHFYGKKPSVEKLIFRIIGNTSALEQNLLSGDLDLISSVGITLDQALALEKKIAAQGLPYKVITQPTLKYEHIDLLADNPALQDARVRKALLYALNREEMTQALFKGKIKIADHFLAPLDPAFTEDPKYVTKYPFSRREAQRLLEDAGWKVGAGGFRYKDGKKLTLRYMTTAGDKMRETVQTFFKDQWKAVGADVVMKNEPARVLIADTLQKRRYDSMIMYYWTATPESSRRAMFHSTEIPTQKNNWTGMNYPGWKNAKADKLLDAIELEFDRSKRIQMTREVLKEYTEDLPVLPLYYRSDIAVVPVNMTGFEMTGHYYTETYSVENWALQ